MAAVLDLLLEAFKGNEPPLVFSASSPAQVLMEAIKQLAVAAEAQVSTKKGRARQDLICAARSARAVMKEAA